MDLGDVAYKLRLINTRIEFDEWVSTNIDELTDFFYTLSKDDLSTLNFDTDFYSGVFTQCPVFKEFQVHKNHTEPFDSFLFLLASVAEKLAEYFQIVGPMENLLPYLPESSVKYRLEALIKSQSIDNSRTEYIMFLPDVLQLLQKAANTGEESQTQRLVDFLIYYFQKAERILTEKEYLSELEQLKNEFSSEQNLKRYRFLGHFTIQEIVGGRNPFELHIENIEKKVLRPSEIIDALFKDKVNQPVLRHQNSEGYSILMGYECLKILDDILQRGKAKFDEHYESITPDERVLLYCYFNMKKHFFTSFAVFRKMWTSMNPILSNNTYVPVFMDLGCGPLTSGLAFAELFQIETGEPLRVNYIGVDISKAMIKKANEFSGSNLFHSDSTFRFYKNWNDIKTITLKDLAGKNTPIFLNASYLFSNLSAEVVEDLVNFVKKLVAEYKNVHFIFQNPDGVDRNINWNKFRKLIDFKVIDKNVERVNYKTSRNSFREPTYEDVYYEILTLKP